MVIFIRGTLHGKHAQAEAARLRDLRWCEREKVHNEGRGLRKRGVPSDEREQRTKKGRLSNEQLDWREEGQGQSAAAALQAGLKRQQLRRFKRTNLDTCSEREKVMWAVTVGDKEATNWFRSNFSSSDK